MASEVDICNLALSHLRVAAIVSLLDTTTRAAACNTHYAVARDTVLREHAWGFAKKRKILIIIEDTYAGWDYSYLYPADCIVAHEIYDRDGSVSGTIYDSEIDAYVSAGRVEFEVSIADDLAADVTITGATTADPIVITAAGHAYVDGEQVIISDVVGMTELNGRVFIVDDAAATFSLDDSNDNDVDGTKYTAYESGGTANKINGNRKLILTNKEDAELVYTAQVTNTLLFDPLFTDVLSAALAVKLARPLKADQALKKELQEQYQFLIAKATASSANESFKKPDNSNNVFVNAR